MKTYEIFLCSIVLFGCKKISVDEPGFTVTTDKTSYNIGDTVKFRFTGNPDNIVFYSGEPGFNYDHRNRISGEGIAQINFTSYLQNAGESNTLNLLISTDFNGTKDSASVANATWTDITSRATLSTGVDKTPSGVIDLSDFAALNKPAFIAFRYLGYQHATLKQPTWTIRTFNVLNVLPDGKTSTNAIAEQIGWVAFNFKNPTVAWTVPTSGIIVINGTGTGSVNEDNDDWVVSRSLDLKRVSPDAGVSIRSLSTVAIMGYTYVYKGAGTYNATFVAFNSSVDEQKGVVQKVTINVQ